MLLALALASLALAGAGAILVLVIATRRVAVSRFDLQSTERRLTPAAVALTFGEAPCGAALSKRDGIVFARLLGHLAKRLRGGSRELIAIYFEDRGAVRDAILGLSDRRAWRRARAAHQLGEMGSPTAVPALVEALHDVRRDVRTAAARSLGELAAPEAVEALVAALSSGRIPRGVVGQSVLALGAQAVPRLLPLLIHADAEVRSMAAELIGLLGGAGDAGHLVSRLADPSAAVRRGAAIALGRLGAADAYTGLDGTLFDRAPQVRAAAAEALGLIGNAAAFPLLLQVARTDSFEPARAAAHALARLAPDLLQAAARDESAGPFVREAAETAAMTSRRP